MFREHHPQYSLVTRARTSRTWDPTDKDHNCVLIVQPNDSQFADIMKNAGIVPSEHEKDILDDIDTPTPLAPPPEPENPYDKWKKLV